MTLESRIAEEIRHTGPITVARYMELALADPEGGYYTNRDPLGMTGDFITAPEISQIFGELCGIWLAESWINQGLTHASLVEPGPGRGTLMADGLRATKHVGGFHEHIDVTMVEISPVLRAAQEKTLKGKHPRIRWTGRIPQEERPLLLVANEFFDALPIHQYIASEGGWHERLVTLPEKGAGLTFSRSGKVHDARLPKGLQAGTIVEESPVSVEVMKSIADRIARHGGAALVIDYGYFRLDGMHSTGDTLQAVRGHQFHDVLHAPGSADITAHVNFSALAEAAESMGAQASPILSQRDFLSRMGAKQRAEQLLRHAQSDAIRDQIMAGYERLTSSTAMGDLFLVLAVTPKGVHAPVF